eukprot:417142-Pleurochrysis_carterae.AAC.1
MRTGTGALAPELGPLGCVRACDDSDHSRELRKGRRISRGKCGIAGSFVPPAGNVDICVC